MLAGDSKHKEIEEDGSLEKGPCQNFQNTRKRKADFCFLVFKSILKLNVALLGRELFPGGIREVVEFKQNEEQGEIDIFALENCFQQLVLSKIKAEINKTKMKTTTTTKQTPPSKLLNIDKKKKKKGSVI